MDSIFNFVGAPNNLKKSKYKATYCERDLGFSSFGALLILALQAAVRPALPVVRPCPWYGPARGTALLIVNKKVNIT